MVNWRAPDYSVAAFGANIGIDLGGAPTLASFASSLIGIGYGALGPIPGAVGQRFRNGVFELSDPAVMRGVQYEMQRASVNRARDQMYTIAGIGLEAFTGRGYVNTIPDIGALLRLFHQLAIGPNGVLDARAWGWLQSMLSSHGIDLATPLEENAPARAQDWWHIASMAATAAPLGSYVQDFHRTRGTDAADEAWDRLKWTMRRAGFSRPEDREQIYNSWSQWSPDDAWKLWLLGVANDEQYRSLVRAAGYTREEDERYLYLSQRVIPSVSELLAWQSRHLWDDEIARRYGLGETPQGSEKARYYCRVQGFGAPESPLPGEVDGRPDWQELAYRAGRRLPGLGECLEMQYRFRPLGEAGGASVVEDVTPWLANDTRNMLLLHGYPEQLATQLTGLAQGPISIRHVSMVLFEVLRHPEIAARVQRMFPAGTDFVKGVYQDHGLSERNAEICSIALRSQADDHYHADLWSERAALRKEKRDTYLHRYRVGTITQEQLRPAIITEWFDAAMADDAILVEDMKLDLGVVESQVKIIREMFLKGNLNEPGVRVALAGLNISPYRIGTYVSQWIWERTEGIRTLSTTEILTALKAGMMTPAIAQLRLRNLGWQSADALIQVAEVEQKMTQQRVVQQQHQAALNAAAAAKDAKAKAAADAAAAKQALLDEKAADLSDLNELLSQHQMLMSRDKFYSAYWKSQVDLLAAEKKADQNALNHVIARSLADYQKYMIDQIKAMARAGKHGQELQTQGEPGADSASTDLGAIATAVPPAPNDGGDSGSNGEAGNANGP